MMTAAIEDPSSSGDPRWVRLDIPALHNAAGQLLQAAWYLTFMERSPWFRGWVVAHPAR
jgi:hypothetical protein